MKGVIAKCLGDLVCEKFGKDKWEKILEETGLSKYTIFATMQDINDEDVFKVIDSTCKVLNITFQQAADAFGDYWVNDFASKMYGTYFTGVTSAKDLLLKMDNVHDITTKKIPNAHPPRFDYRWENEKTLIMTYNSSRNMVDFVVSLIKGVGRYFKEELTVMKLNEKDIKVVFK